MNTHPSTNNPYILLTPGPLTTTDTVRNAMMKDWCTWDDEYNNLVQNIRQKLVHLATETTDKYSTVLMQGSGTFSVESVIGTAIPNDGKLLILANGAYGERMISIAEKLMIDTVVLRSDETSVPNVDELNQQLENDKAITHVAVVHCETTTGMLAPLEAISRIIKKHDKIFILDAMSSFGGIEMDIHELHVDYLISSANKCIQGVPGFGFIIANKDQLEKCKHNARSLSLDLYDQWKVMENLNGKWRFTSPTHVVHAFYQALQELEDEGGIKARATRYAENQKMLISGMMKLDFKPLLATEYQSPIITSFNYPDDPDFDFRLFYNKMKEKGFVLYPGKVTHLDTFRIGNIGDVHPADMERLLTSIQQCCYWEQSHALS